MFVESFVTSFGGAVLVTRPMSLASRALSSHIGESRAVRVAACAAESSFLLRHLLTGLQSYMPAGSRPPGARTGPLLSTCCAAPKKCSRAALRAAYVGGSLTPTDYAILAMTVATVALVAAMLSTSLFHNELGRAFS
jgi:hypothetical protein